MTTPSKNTNSISASQEASGASKAGNATTTEGANMSSTKAIPPHVARRVWRDSERLWRQGEEMWKALEEIFQDMDASGLESEKPEITQLRLSGSRWSLFWRLFKAASNALIYGKATVNVVRKHKP